MRPRILALVTVLATSCGGGRHWDHGDAHDSEQPKPAWDAYWRQLELSQCAGLARLYFGQSGDAVTDGSRLEQAIAHATGNTRSALIIREIECWGKGRAGFKFHRELDDVSISAAQLRFALRDVGPDGVWAALEPLLQRAVAGEHRYISLLSTYETFTLPGEATAPVLGYHDIACRSPIPAVRDYAVHRLASLAVTVDATAAASRCRKAMQQGEFEIGLSLAAAGMERVVGEFATIPSVANVSARILEDLRRGMAVDPLLETAAVRVMGILYEDLHPFLFMIDDGLAHRQSITAGKIIAARLAEITSPNSEIVERAVWLLRATTNMRPGSAPASHQAIVSDLRWRLYHALVSLRPADVWGVAREQVLVRNAEEITVVVDLLKRSAQESGVLYSLQLDTMIRVLSRVFAGELGLGPSAARVVSDLFDTANRVGGHETVRIIVGADDAWRGLADLYVDIASGRIVNPAGKAETNTTLDPLQRGVLAIAELASGRREGARSDVRLAALLQADGGCVRGLVSSLAEEECWTWAEIGKLTFDEQIRLCTQVARHGVGVPGPAGDPQVFDCVLMPREVRMARCLLLDSDQ